MRAALASLLMGVCPSASAAPLSDDVRSVVVFDASLVAVTGTAIQRYTPPRLQGRARVSGTPLNNILSYAGRERANGQKAGLPASELASAQRDLLWQLAAASGEQIRYLRPQRGTLEEVFLKAVDEGR